MKWKILLIVLLLLSATFTVVAVNQLQNQKNISPSETNDVNQSQEETNSVALSAQVTHDSLNLIMTTDKPTYELGESIVVNLTLMNTGDDNLTLQLKCGAFFSLSIWGENDHEVLGKLYSLHYLDTVTYIPLRPGDSFNYTFTWGQINQEGQQVDPGKYRLIINLIPFDILDFCPPYDHYGDYFLSIPSYTNPEEFPMPIPEPVETNISMEAFLEVSIAE